MQLNLTVICGSTVRGELAGRGISAKLALMIFSESNGETKSLSYRVLLREEPEGGYTVSVPSLPGCITFGATISEAITMAREAIELYLESLQAHGEDIPTEENTLEYTITIPANA